MADVLVPVPFSADLLPYVQGYNYGSQPWEQELAQWMREESLSAVANGAKVWLYQNQAGDCVGYGSLGERNWSYPTKKSAKVTVLVIPAVAIRADFQGEPRTDRSDDPSVDGRYSSQIMRHLLEVAYQWPRPIAAIGLFVDPRNVRAVKLYQKYGFTKFDPPFIDKDSGIAYDRYAVRRG
jgi:ribosomal protein S18 acetylase RimI-like enzyme